MAEGKWIEGLEAETPYAQAARHVLAVRLSMVARRLPAALDDAHRDPEHVHQLRVAARRAETALRLFEDCLPAKVFKKARVRLRRLRRTAGAARDWDVFQLEVLTRRASRPASDRPGLDYLAGLGQGHRTAAQEALVRIGAKERKRIDALVTSTVAAVAPVGLSAGIDTLLNRARCGLTNLLHQLENAAAADLSDYPRLHNVRVAGKRLRYAMEVFAASFPPFFVQELYPQIEQVQEVLGRANDSRVAIGRLQGLCEQAPQSHPEAWPHWRPGVEGLLRSHQRRLPQLRRQFLRLWQRWEHSATRSRWALILGE